MEERIEEIEKRIAALKEDVQKQPEKLAEGLKNVLTNIRISNNEKSSQKLIKAKPRYFNKLQVIINILLIILIILLIFEAIRRNIILNEMQEQLNKLQKLIIAF